MVHVANFVSRWRRRSDTRAARLSSVAAQRWRRCGVVRRTGRSGCLDRQDDLQVALPEWPPGWRAGSSGSAQFLPAVPLSRPL